MYVNIKPFIYTFIFIAYHITASWQWPSLLIRLSIGSLSAAASSFKPIQFSCRSYIKNNIWCLSFVQIKKLNSINLFAIRLLMLLYDYLLTCGFPSDWPKIVGNESVKTRMISFMLYVLTGSVITWRSHLITNSFCRALITLYATI